MGKRLQRQSSDSVESLSVFAVRLPNQIVPELSERLCWVSVIVATITVAMVTLGYLFQQEFARALQQPSLRLTCLGLVFASGALFLIDRNGWLTKQRLLDVALLFQILVSFSIGMMETAVPMDAVTPIRGVTYVGLWFFLCAFLLPNAPLRVAFFGIASILSWLLAYRVNLWANGFDPYPTNRIALVIGQMVVTGVWMFLINRQVISMLIKQYRAEQLGSYEMHSIIGRGGMGEVWRARHRLLARNAAIKLLRGDVLHASTGREEGVMRKRFEREAQVTASLQSPHTVALYDFGQSRDGRFYYVMELLHGVDLQHLVERFGPLHPGRVRNILIQACESLEEAHRAGLVHRDIKPKNILLSKLGLQYDFVKILDFGLVKVQQQGLESAVTMEGITAGTPAYLAPEVALGQQIDGRADLYSLGCVAYYLLTGQTVFDEPSPVAYALAHVQKPVIPIRERVELPISPGLEAMVMQLLEKRPDDRIQTAWELGRKVRGLTDVPEFCPYTAEEWWKTNLPEMVSVGVPEVFLQNTPAESDAVRRSSVAV